MFDPQVVNSKAANPCAACSICAACLVDGPIPDFEGIAIEGLLGLWPW